MYRATIGLVIRRNLRAVLAIGLLCGLVVGIGLWGLATARRTASTYERYLRSADTSDVSVNVVTFERALSLDELVEISDAGAAIDGVIADASYVGMESMILEIAIGAEAGSGEILGSLDGRFLVQDRVAVTDGRLPDIDRADEALINEVTASTHDLDVGDTTGIFVASVADIDAGNFDENGNPPVVATFDVEVVGIGTFPGDVLDDEYDQLGRVLLTPAATERWIDVAGSYVWHGLRLEDPDDVDRVVAAYRELAGEDVFLNTLVTADQATDVQRAVRPVVAALVIFGAAALVAALGVGAIAVSRLTRGRPELAVLRAIGVRPRQLVLISCGPAAASAMLAGVVGTAVAVALSPLAPLGSIRAVEPARGVDLDVVVVGSGAVVVGLTLVTAAVVAALRTVRVQPAAPTSRRSPLAARLGAALPAAAALGVRRGIGASPVNGAPTRAALAGTTLALVAVVASLTFGASLAELSDTPARYGWATDLALTAGSGYDTIDLDEAGRLADADDRIDGFTVVGFTDVEIDGQLVPGMGAVAVRGDPQVTLLDGRLPKDAGELSLGRRTADRIGVGPGDEVDGPDGPLRVVGIVAFPAIGPATSAHPGMGEGALFTLGALADAGAQPSIAFVDLAEGVDHDAAAREMTGTFAATTDGGVMQPFLLLRPAELDGAEDANGTVGAIAGVVGAAAVVGLATVVMASVRGRRRELAVLRVLGFTAGDLRRSVRWQAGSLALLAIAVGTPIGVAGGRLTWQTFAETLGVDPAPTVPVALVLGSVVLAAALASAAALPAAGQAARMPVAPALRPE